MGPIAGEIAQAFVRIRPNTAGFQSETEHGVKKALLTVGKITAGFFAVRGITEEVKKIASVAAEHQAGFAVLGNTVENARAATSLYGKDLETLLTQEARLKGFNENELATSFGRLIASNHDTAKSYSILTAAEDIARARHVALGGAVRALDRAQQGSLGALARIGIVVPKVTTEQDKLVRQHERLAAAGVKFTGQTKEVYEAQLRQAKAADAQASRIGILATVQERFGGSAKTFAETAEGSFDRFGVSVHQLEVELGEALLPTLGEAADGLAGWVDELRQSDDAQSIAASTVGLIRDVFNDVRATVIALTPALRPVVSLFGDLARFSGVGGILLAVTAFKAAKIAIDLGTAARAKFIALGAADRAASAQAAAAHQAEAAAVGENSGKLTSHVAAADADARATARATTSTLEFTSALRANSATLAENAVEQKARAALGASNAAAAVPTAGAGVTVAEDSGIVVTEAASASQAAEAVRELGAAASESGASVLSAAADVGELASDIDHTTNVAGKASTSLKAYKVANVEAATASTGLAASETEVASASAAVATSESEAAAATTALATAETRAAAAANLNAKSQQALNASTASGALGAAGGLEKTAAAANLSAKSQRALGASQVSSLAGLRGTSTGAIGAAKGLERVASVATRFASIGGRVAAGLRALGGGLLSLVGGWPVITAAALAATAFGIYKLITAETALERANARLRTSFDAIASGLSRQDAATRAYGDAVSSLRSERIAVAEAQIGLERAKTALATSKAGHATLEYRQLIADLAGAQDQLRLAERNVDETEGDIAKNRRHRADATKDLDKARNEALSGTLAILREIGTEEARTTGPGADAALKSAQRGLAFSSPSEAGIKAGEKTAAARKKLADDLREQAKKQADEGHTFVARQLRDLANFVGALQRVPSRKVFEIFFKAPKTSAAQAISAELGHVGHDLQEAQAQGAKGIAALVAQLDRERAAVAASDRPLARRLRIIEELARVAGKRLRPQVVDFILRSNIEVGIKKMIAELDRARVSSRTFGDELRAEAASLSQSNPALARKLIILAQFSALLGRLPKKHETEVALKAPTVVEAAVGLQGLLAGMDDEAKKHGAKSGEAFGEAFLAGLAKIPFLRAGLAGQLDAAVEDSARSGAAALKIAEAAAKAQLATARDAVKTAKEGVDSAREALQGSRESLADAQRSLADGIRAGQEQVADAVRSAGANLTSIGGELSDLVSRFFDEQQARLDAKAGGQQQHAATGPLAERLKRLRALIAEGQGSPELIREAEQVEAELQALADKQDEKKGDSKLEKRKERVQRRLADLTDEFNTGKISLARFNREVLALLKREGINYKSAGRLLGVAFADGFRQALKDIKAQAAAIAKFGRLPGVSGQSDIVRPAQVAKDVQAQISRDQLAVERQERDVLKDSKTLQAKETTLAKANAKADAISTKLGNLKADAAATRSNTGATARHTAAQLARLLDLVHLAQASARAAARDRAIERKNRRDLPRGTPEIQGGFAGGGIVPGHRTRQDSVHAMVSPGEAILTDHGQGLVDRIGGPGAMDWVLQKQRPHFATGGRVPENLGGLGPGATRHWGWSTRALEGEPRLRQHGYRLAKGAPDWCDGDQRQSNAYCRGFVQRFQQGGRPEIQAGLGPSRHWGWSTHTLEGDPRLRLHGYKLAKNAPDWCEGDQRHGNAHCQGFVKRFRDGGIVPKANTSAPESRPSYANGGIVETGLLRFVAEAEERGRLFQGQTSLTILVNADARPARRVLDELRREVVPATNRLPRPRIEDDLRRAIPIERDDLRRADPRRDLPPTPGGRIAIPAPRERVPLVPPLDPSDIARTQRDAMLREERIQTRILERIARDEAAQTLILRDVEIDVRPRRGPNDHRKNPTRASDQARAAARNNLIGQ